VACLLLRAVAMYKPRDLDSSNAPCRAAIKSTTLSDLIGIVAFVISAAACGGTVQYDNNAPGAGGSGAIASGTIATGGSAMSRNVGGAGGSPATAAFDWGGFGGLPFTAYCAGTAPKIYAFGKYLSPQVTSYQPNVAQGCCETYGLDFQTDASLGFDLHVEIAVPRSGVPSGVCYTNNPKCPQANAIRTDTSTTAAPTVGTIRMDSDPTGVHAFLFGVCVEIDDQTSDLFGTRIFYPSPTAERYW